MAGLNTYLNLLFNSKNELVRAFIKGNNTSTLSLVVFQAQTLVSTQSPALLLLQVH